MELKIESGIEIPTRTTHSGKHVDVFRKMKPGDSVFMADVFTSTIYSTGKKVFG